MRSIKSISLFCLILVCLIVITINFSGITPPTVVAAQDTEPTLGQWHFYDDVLDTNRASSCGHAVSKNGFVLGMNASCNTGLLGGTATSVVDIPPADRERVLLIRIVCLGGSGCTKAIAANAQGNIVLSVDGQNLWSVKCDSTGLCNQLAVADTPEIAYVTTPSSQHSLTLSSTPHVQLAIDRIEVSWQKIPSLIRGIGYSPFRDCQNPHFGSSPTEADIYQDMATLRNMGNAIRTYSSTGVQGKIPAIARQFGLRVSAGAALGPEKTLDGKAHNEAEIASVIALSHTVDLESIIVGNEVLLRGDLTEQQLYDYIDRVKAAVNVPVTTAATSGEYYTYPNLFNHVDYALVHIYAFWQNQPIENAAQFVADQYHDLEKKSNGKHVVIGETGWASGGPVMGNAVPSPENQRRFLREFLTVAGEENIEFYYFSAFNELWKTGEGGVGQFWGILDSNRENQYDLQSVLIPMHVPINASAVASSNTIPVPTMTAVPSNASQPDTFPIYTNYAVVLGSANPANNHFAPSGYMGDWHSMQVDTCAQDRNSWAKRVIAIHYKPSDKDPGGWTGVYWQQPENNWANMAEGGFNLQKYSQLHFHARADIEGAKVKFMVGGVSDGQYPSSLRSPIFVQGADSDGFVSLSTSWQEYNVDLQGMNLSNVIDGFGWVGDRNHTPNGVTVYLDDIVFDTQPPPLTTQFALYNAETLAPGFELNVDTSRGLHNWVTNQNGEMQMDYPSGQQWGAVFLTVGKASSLGQRASKDLSAYDSISVDLRGEQGTEVVSIGIKTATDPDNGKEIKKVIHLTNQWQTYTFSLSDFGLTSEELKQIYVPIEFVFERSSHTSTIYFKNILYLRSLLAS